MPALTTSVQHRFGGSSQHDTTWNRNKRHLDFKDDFSCRQHDIYIENPIEFTKQKTLELVSGFCKVTGYKDNTKVNYILIY